MIYIIRKYFVKTQKFIQLSNEEDSHNNSPNSLDLPSREQNFIKDLEYGLSSSNFNIEENIASDDSRPGLKDSQEIIEIMKLNSCTFDEARLIRQKKVFKMNGIDPETGIPLDSKFVTFDSLLGEEGNSNWDNN